MLTDQVFEILLDGLNFILVLGIAVVIHEAGHFIVARLSGIRVEKFSIGFGKPLASIRRGETEYILAPIPMGGYVKLAGDNPAEITGKQDEFYSISPWRRIPTVIAGPGANIIGAFLILFSLAYLFGTPYDYNIVGSVIPGSLEAKAGLQKNDVLLSVNGIEVRTWDEYLSEIQSLRKSGKEAASVEVRRGTKTLSVSLPVSMKEIDKCLVLSFVDPVGPGFAAGLETGDRILSIDHQSPDTWSKFREITTNLLEETPQGPVPRTVSLSWQNTNGEIKSASITPALVKNETGEHTALLGVGQAAVGISPKVPPVVGRIARGYPAADIDLHPGDQIVAVNGNLVETAEEVERAISFSYKKVEPGTEEKPEPIPVEVSWIKPKGEEVHTATITPQVEMSPFRSDIGLQLAREFPLARVGISFEEPTRALGFMDSIGEAVDETINACAETWFVLKGLFTGQVNHRLIGGPVAILQISARVGKEGLRRLLWFCAFLQVNLALLNLLPIPVLDGGHLVVALCEGISRRTFSLRTREVIQYIGLVILLPLFIFVFINDFARIGLFKWIKELMS